MLADGDLAANAAGYPDPIDPSSREYPAEVMTTVIEPLSVQGLVKSYGDVHAVRGIDFAVRQGEVFGFVGPNGAGKSTTIRCILDLLRPSAGEIRLFGRNPSVDSAKIRERVAYVPGELHSPSESPRASSWSRWAASEADSTAAGWPNWQTSSSSTSIGGSETCRVATAAKSRC